MGNEYIDHLDGEYFIFHCDCGHGTSSNSDGKVTCEKCKKEYLVKIETKVNIKKLN